MLFISSKKLFLSRGYLSFRLFLVMQENSLIRKLRKQIIVIHILPNISRSKDNQTMKFGQLREYNIAMADIFSYIKCGGENSPGPFSKKLHIFGSTD